MCKNEHFQSSGTKNEFHAKFRDENNSLTKNICDVLNPRNMLNIESDFLLDSMLLLENCRDCILNHYS